MKPGKPVAATVAALLVAALGSHPAAARPGAGHSRGSSHGHNHNHNHNHNHSFHRGSVARVTVFAAPVFAARYYFPPSYYYPPPVYYPAPIYYPPAPPPVYIEQGAPPSYAVPPQSQYQQPQDQTQGPYLADPQAFWYYCAASRQYYPHVQSCPGGWQRVAPQPPPR